MRLIIDTPPLPEPVYVDRDMWEKIVLNLVSNAFKYTLAGEIRVGLHADAGMATLTVSDTGTGIPEHELPNIFNRFHRVEGARGRTQEGTGIGLALVQELARIHGGITGVRSTYGVGSTFTVAIPLGKGHLPADRIGTPSTLASTALGANPFIEEALRWFPDTIDGNALPITESPTAALAPSRPIADRGPAAKVVLADDNADMREYVKRLLSADYDVISVGDGVEALEAITRHRPDLVITDVMMPRLDGYQTCALIKKNSRFHAMPVVMLSSKDGLFDRARGRMVGSDQYLTKPFTKESLLKAVAAHVRAVAA